jgi:hypothetical protein
MDPAYPWLLLDRVAEVVAAMPLLVDRLEQIESEGALGELAQDLDSWWAYAVTDITLGVPFSIKTSETLPLARGVLQPEEAPLLRRASYRVSRWWTQTRRTSHHYPLFLKDAAAVHVEVDIREPELRAPLPRPGASPPRVPGLVMELNADDALYPSLSFVFANTARASERLFHYYSARRIDEAPDRDYMNPYLKLYIPIRLKPWIVAGYSATVVTHF